MHLISKIRITPPPNIRPALRFPFSSNVRLFKRDWQELTEEVFKKVFKKSAVKRTKYEDLRRNIAFLEKEG